jgi:predicted PhzF superfamily epimerase YddE/YHI9
VDFGSSCFCDTLAGRLNIELSNDTVFMDMAAPRSMGEISGAEAVQELYSIMGIGAENQGAVLSGGQTVLSGGQTVLSEGQKAAVLVPEMISTGLPDIMLPVQSEEELAAIKPDFPALSKLSERYEVVGVHAFTVNASDGAVHCRNFAPLYAIDEEAATGTSNGALTYYLYKNSLIGECAENLFIQGEAMDRPSKIRSRLTAESGTVKIQVGGSGVILAVGEINL